MEEGTEVTSAPAAQFSKMHIKLNVKRGIARWVPPLGLPDRNEMKAGGQEGAVAILINS